MATFDNAKSVFIFDGETLIKSRVTSCKPSPGNPVQNLDISTPNTTYIVKRGACVGYTKEGVIIATSHAQLSASIRKDITDAENKINIYRERLEESQKQLTIINRFKE